MSEEIKVGDYILVTDGPRLVKSRGMVGNVYCVVRIDYESSKLKYEVRGRDFNWWCDGVPLTSLLKELF